MQYYNIVFEINLKFVYICEQKYFCGILNLILK